MSEATDYEIVDGAIIVFGHKLNPREPLPDLGDCEECGSFHTVNFVRSPDEQRVLIVSDVQLANFDVWLFDTRTKSSPTRILDNRRGRHFTQAEWFSNSRFRLSFGGMGYTTSLFIDLDNPGAAKDLGDLLIYDAERDVYVRYLYDAEALEDVVEVGFAFSTEEPYQRFPISLDNEYRSESRFMIESVELDGPNLIVEYQTRAKGLVKDVFRPLLLVD